MMDEVLDCINSALLSSPRRSTYRGREENGRIEWSSIPLTYALLGSMASGPVCAAVSELSSDPTRLSPGLVAGLPTTPTSAPD